MQDVSQGTLQGKEQTSMKIHKMAEGVRESINRITVKKKEEEVGARLSTGSTLLNLALSGDSHYGFLGGHYYFLVGDSNSGKTFTSMTCFAEAAKNPAFDNHLLIYDNVEDGMLMDVERLFGKEVARRIRPPRGTVENPRFSEVIEELYYNLDDINKKGQPFIYVLDSMDGLSSHDEQKKFEEQKKAYEKGKEAAGSYGDGKAKKNSANLRKVLSGLRKTDSILIIISQTRDNITGWGDPKTRSGGRALRFYATAEIWTSPTGIIKKTIRGKERKIGIKITAQTKKNRLTGELHDIPMDIYPSYGIDDIGACVDFLVSEGWWKKDKDTTTIKTVGDIGEGTRESLIRRFDKNISPLRKEVAKCWKTIEEESALKRTARYK